MRIVFLATGEIAIPAFKTLLNRGDCEMLALVTQPDRPTGRKQALTPPAIKLIAEAHDIPVFQPEKIATIADTLAKLSADFFVVMAYGQLLPQRVINTPKTACLNLHGSLLPRHRGASPIQAAIMAGDAETGVTVMHVVRALDAGDIVNAKTTPIRSDDTGGILHDRLAEVAATAIDKAMDAFASETATRTPQDEAQVTYLGKLTRADGAIDWTQSAETIERMIRAFDPWPGTTTTLHNGDDTLLLKVFPPVDVVKGEPRKIGAVHSDGGSLLIGCGDTSTLRIHTIQPEGKRRMSVADFLRGYTLRSEAVCGEHS